MSIRREFHCDWRDCNLNQGTWQPEPFICDGWTRITTAGVNGSAAENNDFCSLDHLLLWLGEQPPDLVEVISGGPVHGDET